MKPGKYTALNPLLDFKPLLADWFDQPVVVLPFRLLVPVEEVKMRKTASSPVGLYIAVFPMTISPVKDT
jgi:hypothetical protein